MYIERERERGERKKENSIQFNPYLNPSIFYIFNIFSIELIS
jgi:hypothetical protein